LRPDLNVIAAVRIDPHETDDERCSADDGRLICPQIA
jgi:hypothetical protein